MKSALDVHRALLAADVPHEMVRLTSPALSADDLPRCLGVPDSSCLAVRCYVVTAAAGGHTLCAVMVRAGDTPDPASLLDALAATAIRPAAAAEVNAGTDFAAPLVSPIGLPADLLLLADAAIGASEVLYAPTGESGVALGIRTGHLLVACRARVTNLTARPLAAEERSGWLGPASWEPAGREAESSQTAGAQVLALRSRQRADRRIG